MRAITLLIAVAAMTTTAVTANGALQDGPGGMLNWLALGLCAAVLVGQTLPAIMMMLNYRNITNRPSAAAPR